jgi:hypothetical protein
MIPECGSRKFVVAAGTLSGLSCSAQDEVALAPYDVVPAEYEVADQRVLDAETASESR